MSKYNFDSMDMMDLLIIHSGEKFKEVEDVSDIKSFLLEIDHPKKDNASYCFELYNYFKEPICIK